MRSQRIRGWALLGAAAICLALPGSVTPLGNSALAGTTLDLDLAAQNDLFDVARTAWADAGKPAPHLATSFWFVM